MGAHLINGEFQSDKYPTTPRGKVPLSVKDPTAQDLLWEYAQRRRSVDAEFSDDLETALRAAGYVPVGGQHAMRCEGPMEQPAAEHAFMTLNAVQVTTDNHVEAMRQIRNTCREFMTKHTAYIEPAEQQAWWEQRNPLRAWLFYVGVEPNGTDECVGYGLVQWLDDKWWLSGGLKPVERGHGLGAQLFGFLAASAGRPCWLEVRETNVRAIKTYEKIGFVERSRKHGIITMELPEPVPFMGGC